MHAFALARGEDDNVEWHGETVMAIGVAGVREF